MKNFRSHTTGANAWGNCEGLRRFPARLGSMMNTYSEELSAKVWERLPGETSRGYQVFCKWRDSGYNEAGEKQERLFFIELWRQVSGKSQATKLPGAFIRWAYAVDDHGNKVPGRPTWSERVAAYDDYLEARNRARKEEECLRRQEEIREMTWERVLKGHEAVCLVLAILLYIVTGKGKEPHQADDFRDLIPARDKLSILKVLGCLAQRELDAGMADCRADLGMLTGRTKLDIHVEREA